MKRASVQRHLHMGCGEGLHGRRTMAAARPAGRAGPTKDRPAAPKNDGGRR